MHDLVIRGGTGVDRTGGAPPRADEAADGRVIRYLGTVEARVRR
jgi:hypothetical protein